MPKAEQYDPKWGTQVTPAEKKKFEDYRSAGWSVKRAAMKIGRSASWGYQYEREQKQWPRIVKTEDLFEAAIEAFTALAKGGEEGDFELFDRIVERKGKDIAFDLAVVTNFVVKVLAKIAGEKTGAEVVDVQVLRAIEPFLYGELEFGLDAFLMHAAEQPAEVA